MFDNEVLVAVAAPICVFVVLFLIYALAVFAVTAPARTVRRFEATTRIQILWIVVTTVTVIALAGFGSYELDQGRLRRWPGPERRVPSPRVTRRP